MNPSQRIVINATATYAHSILAAGLALFSSRWVLAALGASDFGLFSVVGSLIMFVTFINTTLACSVSRHYAFSLGKDNSKELGVWFNAALSIHLFLAMTLVLIGWPAGEYVIEHILSIPDERVATCLMVFRISLLSAFTSMASVPFAAMFTARQRFVDLAIWNMLHSVMTFSLAWLLIHSSGDRLLLYAFGMVGILVFIHIGQVFWAISVFAECRIRIDQWFNKMRCKAIVSFAGWSMVGGLGGIFRNQGSAILLNINFGPTVNAAYGIANQVSAQTDKLSAAMIGAFSPEIIRSEGHGARHRMQSLSQRASKFGAILVIIFAIPLIIEMDYVLKIWLINPPPFSATLCMLLLSSFIISRLSSGVQSAVHATGNIARYEILAGICLISTLPLAWLLLKLGIPPTGVGVAFIITAAAFSIGRALLTARLFGSSMKLWALSVVWPCAIVCSFSLLPSLVPRLLLSESLLRLLCVTLLSVSMSSISTWFFALDNNEQHFVVQNLAFLKNRRFRLLSG